MKKFVICLAVASLISGSTATRLSAASLRNAKQISKEIDAGGSNAYPVMPVPKAFPFPENISPKRCPTGNYHVGCFYDTQLAHRRWYDEEVPKEDRLKMTPDLCYAFCSKVSGVQYFGLTRGDRCYCTPFFHNTGMNAHGDCDMPCVGDFSQMCGGMERSDVYVLHDCKNLPDLPCKRAPPPPMHAKIFKSRYYRPGGTACKNAMREPLTTMQTFCDIECEPGYFLQKNDIRCVRRGDPLGYSWAQVTGQAVCQAISCGKPPPIPHAQNPTAPALYGKPVPYQCQLGYSMDTNPKGLKDFILMCQADGSFNHTKDLGCYKIVCGECPSGEKYSNSKVVEKGKRQYSEQCHYTCDKGYTLDAEPTGKNDFSLSCLASGEFSEPKTCSPVSCGPPPPVANSETLTKEVVVYPNSAEYRVNEGYTITGKVDPGQKFTLKCQANGKYSDIIPPVEWKPPAAVKGGPEMELMKPKIDPVPCGKPPKVENSLYEDTEKVFGESVTYTCYDGYTADGKSAGDVTPVAECGAMGKYLYKGKESPLPECLPVECGEAPKKDNAKLTTKLKTAVVTAASPALVYECNPGYSTDKNDNPYNPVENKATITCQGTGAFTVAKECVNIQDCNAGLCGKHGKCVDIDPPTAKPFDNYECKCDAGFMTTIKKGRAPGVDTKQCTNINDCPAPIEKACGGLNSKGMERGLCIDGLETYTCQPSEGYKVVTKGKNETCEPKECGDVPKVSNSKNPMEGKTANYDTEPWKYTCNEGYSTTGTYGDSTELPCRCTASGKFTTMAECLAVTCGSVHSVANTFISPSVEELKFPTKLTYTADPGYSLNGKKDGGKTFEVECLSDGTQTKTKEMQRVECGTVPKQKFATFDDKKVLVFEDSIIVSCEKGYSTDETPLPESLQYEITCEADGKLHIPGECKYITTPLPDHPIDCGKPPEVAHSVVSGSQLFGEKITYTAVEGYSLDGSTAEAQKSFSISCAPTEEYLGPIRKFQRISCGVSPDVDFTKSVDFIAPTGSSFFQSANAFSNHVPQAKLQIHKSHKLLFQDAVKYTCSEGYHVDMGKPSIFIRGGAPVELTLKCDGKGKIVATKPSNPSSLRCVKVACAVPIGKKSSSYTTNVKDLVQPSGKIRKFVKFEQTQEFVCNKGYSLDGTPAGEKDYTEKCESDGPGRGKLSKKHKCEAIDWCLDNQCGEFGKCISGPYGYRCNCKRGYESVSPDGIHSKCVPILECETEDGDKLCAGDGDAGTCEDDILKYNCKCNAGYEVTTDYLGFEKCTAVYCPSITDREFSVSDKAGQKIQYKGEVSYDCKSGYSIDGNKDGATTYIVKCLIDGALSKVDDCKPVACPCVDGSCVPTVKNGAAKGSFDKALVFGEEAEFECDKGFTTTGNPAALKTFIVSCTATGALTDPGQCLPVECGLAPKIANSVPSESQVLVYKDVATIKCAKGYTTTGEAKGATEMSFECMANGKLKGPGKKGASCMPVSCGTPKKVEHSEFSMRELFFMDQVRVLCHSGYSIDSDANGESSFVGTCGADGEITGMLECKPVSCGKPEAEKGATSKDPETFYTESATWNCLPGFSTDGMKGGDESFDRSCKEHGKFGVSSPDACIDINFCFGNPCTSNGVCTDLGTGKVNPGYSCECAEGYEIKKNSEGGDTCSEDDCHGDPCGAGGTCIDLSKKMKIDDAYTCECELGYELGGTEEKPTCVRTVCGKMPTEISHVVMKGDLPQVTLKTWNGKKPAKDGGVPLMKAGDAVKYTCEKGYSTDGSVAKESKDFSVACEMSGLFSRAISGDSECMLIKCDNMQRPMVPYATFLSEKEDFFEYGDILKFECWSGHTTNAQVGGDSTFQIECTADGDFSPVHESCLPISCKVDDISDSKPSTGLEPVTFGTVVTYSCSEGYVAKGTQDASFSGTCGADGKIKFEGAKECAPIKCGTPQPQPNADLFLPAESAAMLLSTNQSLGGHGGLFKRVLKQEDLVPFPEGKVLTTIDAPVVVKCHSGYTIGGTAGGVATYSMECTKTGVLVAMTGNFKLTETCDAPKFQVSGIATDAQSASEFLDDATVKFTMGSNVYSGTTNWAGKYTALMPAGTYKIEASRSGYITYTAEVIVVASISAGGAADVALSKVLPEGEYRVTLTWAAHSRDLDSHTYLGKNAKDLVYYARKSRTDTATQMSATLDRDDVNGYGPETTTYKGIGTCTDKPHCLVKFLVDNYTPNDGDIGASEAIITLYKGSIVAGKYNLPTDAGSARIWPIFTLNSQKDAKQVLFEGDQIYGPDLAADWGTKNWGSNLDSPGCVKLDSSHHQLLIGLKAASFNGLNRIQEAKYATVDDTAGMSCKEVDWFEEASDFSGDGGYSYCPTGYYMAGFCREGSRMDEVRGPKQITKGYCCKPEELEEEWGSCHTQALFTATGWSGCGVSDNERQTLMVGLQMKYAGVAADESLKALAEAKCCELVGGGMMPNPGGDDDDYGDGGGDDDWGGWGSDGDSGWW